MSSDAYFLFQLLHILRRILVQSFVSSARHGLSFASLCSSSQDAIKHEEVDWSGEEPKEHITGICGALIFWGWPLNNEDDEMNSELHAALRSPSISHHRLGIQLNGEKYHELSEHADKTWWSLVSICRDVSYNIEQLLTAQSRHQT